MEKEQLEKLKKFAEELGVDFDDYSLLRDSLHHRSFLNEHKNDKEKTIVSNERLEFLGDAVLELIITEALFWKYPDRGEGDLTSFRAALVRTESLAETALSLNFSGYLYMSKGEEATGGRTRPYILANTYEAVLGAVYLDQGYETAREYVKRTLFPKLDDIVSKRLDIDSKSKLQEITQETMKTTPIYEVVSEKGPDHDKEFKVKVMLADKSFGEGIGRSKQEAEQNAAKAALIKWAEIY
jgi:ribonuclease-3